MRKLFAFIIIYVHLEIFNAGPTFDDFKLWQSSSDNTDRSWNRHVKNMANDMTTGLQSSWSKLKGMSQTKPWNEIQDRMLNPIVEFFRHPSQSLSRSGRSIKSLQPNSNNLIHTTEEQTKGSKVMPTLDSKTSEFSPESVENNLNSNEIPEPRQISSGKPLDAVQLPVTVPFEYRILNLIETENDNQDAARNQLDQLVSDVEKNLVPSTDAPHRKKSTVKKQLPSTFPLDVLFDSGSEESRIKRLLLNERPDTDSGENPPCLCSSKRETIQVTLSDSSKEALSVLQAVEHVVLPNEYFYILSGPFIWMNGTIQIYNMTDTEQTTSTLSILPINQAYFDSLQSKYKQVPRTKLQKGLGRVQVILREIAALFHSNQVQIQPTSSSSLLF